MEEETGIPPQPEPKSEDLRCPNCDSVVPKGAARCIMCGYQFEADSSKTAETSQVESPPVEEAAADEIQELDPVPDRQFYPLNVSIGPSYQTQLRGKRRSIALWLLTAIIAVITAIVGLMVLRGGDSEVILALQPTFTPLPPPPSLTPTTTPEATETPLATETPVPSATPVPTDTPQPPRYHTVASGETLFGLSLFYRISPDSIAESNNMSLNTQIQVNQQLVIPWPTATPPLESEVLEIGDQKVVIDVTDCQIINIQEGDSIYGLSGQYDVPAEAIVAVNRLTEESIQMLHPGDALCIPQVYPGESLPATAGPQPTTTSTSFPAGPSLLYPTEGMEVNPPDGVLRFQWVAVKNLEEDEWYMVELEDLNLPDILPYRAFTQDSSFRLPDEWRPKVPETHEMRWRVSIVKVTGERSDGGVIYEYGGRGSEQGTFFWLGALPTATPTLTPTPSPTPEE
ncbi:MAG: LysM peptidoglycan-binding domain-containing protein [Candidatus Promineifilaceae bacterium]